MVLKITNPREFLSQLFDVAVAAAQPETVLQQYLPDAPSGRTIVVGAGKASAQMARAFEQMWDGPISGLVVTQYGCAEPCQNIEIVEAAHPVPDSSGFDAAKRMQELVVGAEANDLVVALISGGGSSLLPAPAPGLTLGDEQAINQTLLASGAPISEMNVVRKMFSTIKGGRLALLAAPAPICTLVLSDVPGDDPAMVASGPTIADENGLEEAKRIVQYYEMDLPKAARALLALGGNLPPKPDDPRLARAHHAVIASAALSLNAAAKQGEALGCEVRILSDAIEGEAQDVGREHGRLVKNLSQQRPLERPILVLSGGETTVTLKAGDGSPGKGGRNSEYLLALADEIDGIGGLYALAADTDGRDGSEQNAGAFADGATVARLAAMGMDVKNVLAGHNAWTAFNALRDLLETGPTGTNVNDFRALLIQ